MTKTKIMEIPIEFKRLFDSDWREAAIWGGRFALKSHSVARFLLIKARQEKTKIACFREFQNSIADSSYQLLVDLINLYDLREFNITDKTIINLINGSDFIFKGLHLNEQSIKSIEGIDMAWCEESQTLSKASLEVLTPTVRKPGSKIIYTYNRLLEDDPVHQRLIIEGRPDTLKINVNYDIAIKYKMMPDVILKEIEDDKKNRPALYKHKWLGEPNSMEKKIYNDWQIIDEIPHEARLIRYGLDFGYTNDPCALIAVYKFNDGYILDEHIYSPRIANSDIASYLLNVEKALIVADSAEPKSIAEIASKGVLITKAQRGADSKIYGIHYVQDQKISVTRKSTNIIKEYRGYLWKTDNNDRIINDPIDEDNHAMDAIRYAITSIHPDFKDRLSAPKFATGYYVLESLMKEDEGSYY